MADEIRSGDSKVRVVRLLGHRDNAGAWEIRDFLKRSVVEFQWIELSTEEDCRRELGVSDLKNVNLPVVELPDGTRLFGPTLRDVAARCGFCYQAQAAAVRRLDLGCGSGWPVRGRVCRLGRSEYRADRAERRRGPSRHYVDDRKLHALPAGHQRPRFSRAGPATGGEGRRRALDDAGGCEIDVPR